MRLSKRAPIAERLAARSRREGDCLIYTHGQTWPRGHTKVGYQGRKQFVHRVSFAVANGPIPDGMDVLHHCDVPRCIEPRHLYLGTDVENSRDRVERGRCVSARGTRNGSARLTDQQVERILTERAAGATLKQLAAVVGVTFQTVHRICSGKGWVHIRPDIPRPLPRARRRRLGLLSAEDEARIALGGDDVPLDSDEVDGDEGGSDG